MSTPFEIKCSREIFSEEEITILKRYGKQLQLLADGVGTPRAKAQQRFAHVARGLVEPETIYEKVWCKYLWRLNWERDPANKAATGERRRMPNDREDWKKMRGAVWSGIRRRSMASG